VATNLCKCVCQYCKNKQFKRPQTTTPKTTNSNFWKIYNRSCERSSWPHPEKWTDLYGPLL